MLVSNYYEQRYVKYQGSTPLINAPYCRSCINNMSGSSVVIEPEPKFTYEQGGMTCWNLDAVTQFKRDCGTCVKCHKNITLDSRCSHVTNNQPYFFLIWSSHLASICIREQLESHVWHSNSPSNLYQSEIEPSRVCIPCFKSEQNWIPKDGPVECQLCNEKYQRAIYHWCKEPMKMGIGCECHVYLDTSNEYDTIMDGFIDAEQFYWSNNTRPDNFDPQRPFCYKCLKRLYEDGTLIQDNSDDSDNSN